MTRSKYWNWFGQTVEHYRPVVRPVDGTSIIVGYARNYRLSDLSAFVTSIERNVGAPFILIASLADSEREIIEAAGGQVVAPNPNIGRWSPLPAFARFPEIVPVLQALPRSVDRVIWCDTRDAVFQRDPFQTPFGADIVLYSESDSPKLGATATGRWLARALGENQLKPIADKTMANCGIILANRAALERFLQIVGILAGVARSRLTRIPGFMLDQALVNYVAHNQLAGSTEVRANLGRVANLYGVDAERLSLRDGDLCASDTGVPFEIVHMFDRHIRTAKWAGETYGWNGPADRRRPSFSKRVARRLLTSIDKRIPEIRF